MSRLVHISDLHFGAHDQRVANALKEAIDTLSPSALIVAGDITQKGRRSEFEAAVDFLNQFKCPKIIAPGNHDTPLLNLPARLLSPFGRFNKKIGPLAQPIYEDARSIILPLTTAKAIQLRLNWSLGSVNLSALGELISHMDKHAAGRARILVAHHPLLTPQNAPFKAHTARGPQGAQLMAHGKIDLLLSGHMHVPFTEPLPFGDGRTYALGSGTAMSTRTRASPASFNSIDILPAGFQVAVHSLGKDGFAPTSSSFLPRR